MSDLEIIPTIGVGSARFGQPPSEVLAAMAEPQVYEDWMGGNLNDSLLFQGLILEFDRCDAYGPLPESRLVGARIRSRPGARLFAKMVAEWTREELRDHLRSLGHKSQEGDGDLLIPALGFAVSFDDGGGIEDIDLWEPRPESFWPRLKRRLAGGG